MRIRLILGFLATFLCTQIVSVHADDNDHHVSEANGLRIIHAWTPATSDGEALVFMEIENKSENDVVLKGGKSEIAGAVELVGFQMTDGSPAYDTLPLMPIKSGFKVTLAPKGVALRMTDLSKPLEKGNEFKTQVIFDNAALDIHVEVGDADARKHSHAGQAH